MNNEEKGQEEHVFRPLTGNRQNSISLACARARQSYFAAESITASTARRIGSSSIGHAATTTGGPAAAAIG